MLLKPGTEHGWAGMSAVIFALLVAWDRLYRRERLILLGFGEISVRQAAILVAIIDVIILFFSGGWFITLAMLCGGLAGWIYFVVSHKALMGRASRQMNSERIARLEL